MSGRDRLGARLDARENGVGALRLVLAFAVLASHSWLVGKFGPEPLVGFGDNTTTLGSVAVVGFFVLSGILIARSWHLHPDARSFLRNRALRILPGFWACLVVTAFVLAPLCFVSSHGTLSGYPITGPSSALRYIAANSGLYVRQSGIAGALDGAPYHLPGTVGVLNGSLWTLFYEAVCYVGVLVLGLTGLLRSRWRAVPVAITAGLLVLLAVFAANDTSVELPTSIGITHLQIEVLAAFGIGITMFLFADRITMDWRVFASALVLTVVMFYLGWSEYGALIPLAYVLVWIGLRLPVHNLESRFDLSYGVYLYAFPIQQLLAIRSWNRWGVGAYIAMTAAFAVALAAASWFLVERPSLQLKARTGLAKRTRPAPAPPVEAEVAGRVS